MYVVPNDYNNFFCMIATVVQQKKRTDNNKVLLLMGDLFHDHCKQMRDQSVRKLRCQLIHLIMLYSSQLSCSYSLNPTACLAMVLRAR